MVVTKRQAMATLAICALSGLCLVGSAEAKLYGPLPSDGPTESREIGPNGEKGPNSDPETPLGNWRTLEDGSAPLLAPETTGTRSTPGKTKLSSLDLFRRWVRLSTLWRIRF